MIPGEEHHAGDGGYEESTWEKHNAFVVERNKSMEIKNPEYVCPIHGDIGNHTIFSNIPGHEMRICLICWLEKMTELGVQHVVEKQ